MQQNKTIEDDPVLYQEQKIPNHLVNMIEILIEEERNNKTRKNNDEFQPCLEFFMQTKIMETFCSLAEKDVIHHVSFSIQTNGTNNQSEQETLITIIQSEKYLKPKHSILIVHF